MPVAPHHYSSTRLVPRLNSGGGDRSCRYRPNCSAKTAIGPAGNTPKGHGLEPAPSGREVFGHALATGKDRWSEVSLLGGPVQEPGHETETWPANTPGRGRTGQYRRGEPRFRGRPCPAAVHVMIMARLIVTPPQIKSKSENGGNLHGKPRHTIDSSRSTPGTRSLFPENPLHRHVYA